MSARRRLRRDTRLPRCGTHLLAEVGHVPQRPNRGDQEAKPPGFARQLGQEAWEYRVIVLHVVLTPVDNNLRHERTHAATLRFQRCMDPTSGTHAHKGCTHQVLGAIRAGVLVMDFREEHVRRVRRHLQHARKLAHETAEAGLRRLCGSYSDAITGENGAHTCGGQWRQP